MNTLWVKECPMSLLNPKKPFALIAHITQIRLETERLMKLSVEEYEAEVGKPPSSKVNQIARISA
jgi:hypothetical protein